jgi:hypothetical protein
LLISAGNVMTWADAAFPGARTVDTNNPMTTKAMNGLRIFYPLSLKQTKPTQCGRFRHWLTTALSRRSGLATKRGGGSMHPLNQGLKNS